MESNLEKVLLSPKSLKENNFLPSDATLKKVIELLALPSACRSNKQILMLQTLTRNIKFFVQIIEELGQQMHIDACKAMSYEYFSESDFVFKVGEKGQKFYIILEGTVKVLVPFDNDGEINMVIVAQLHAGMAFGELALIKEQPRVASIICATNSHFAVLTKDDYMKIIGRAEVKKLDKILDFLKEIPLFNKWSKRKLEKLTYYFSYQKFIRKQSVYTRGSECRNVYIVKSGEFELTRPLLLDSNEKGFTVKVALLTTGEIFGEQEAINEEAYRNSCSCYSSSGELIVISTENFITKFFQKVDPADNRKRLMKYKIREKRMKGFKEFVVGEQGHAKSFDHAVTSLKPVLAKGHRRTESVNATWKYCPFSTGQLRKIKKKALGSDGKKRQYISILSPFQSSKREDHSKESVKKQFNELGYGEMATHQPGGFFRGKLKRPKHTSRKSETDTI